MLFLPWLPNFIYQATHTAAPWDSSPRFGAPVQLARDLLGGDRVAIPLLITAVIGFSSLVAKAKRRTREATLLWALIALPVATLALAWIASQITPAWVSRYFAPTLAAILLLAAWGMARAGIVGAVILVVTVILLANPASFTPKYKSDMRDVAGEMAPLLHPERPGDRRPAGADRPELVLPPGRAQIRQHDRTGQRPAVYELGQRPAPPARRRSRRDAASADC